MKRVIEHGNRSGVAIFEHRCPRCGCLFEFEQEDVTSAFFDQREGEHHEDNTAGEGSGQDCCTRTLHQEREADHTLDHEEEI